MSILSSPQRAVILDSASAIFGEAIRKRGAAIEKHRARGHVVHVPSAGVGSAVADEDRHGVLEELQHSFVVDGAAGLRGRIRCVERVQSFVNLPPPSTPHTGLFQAVNNHDSSPQA